MNKIGKSIGSLKLRFKRDKKEMRVSDEQAEEKGNGKSGTAADKMEKALLFFGKNRDVLQKDKIDVPLKGPSIEQNVSYQSEMKRSSSGAKEIGEIPNEKVHISQTEEPVVEMEAGPVGGPKVVTDMGQAGWISPRYSQSRVVQLDPYQIEKSRLINILDNTVEVETYRILRRQLLQRTLDSQSNTVMVTSALPGEGKTLTSINLAFALAREFQHTVLLVDGDLKKQDIHKRLGCDGEKGLIDYLVDSTPLSELIVWPGVEKMTFISGGRTYSESAEILGSPKMRELISEMKGRYPERYIIFDAPSILSGADVLALAPNIDCIIIVVQAGRTSLDDLNKAVKLFPKEKVLGFVLNRCETG